MRIRSVLAVLALSTFAAAAQAEVKIFIVRSVELLQGAPQVKAFDAKLSAEVKKKQAEFDAQKKSIEDDAKAFERDGPTMSAEQRAKKERDLNTRANDLNFAQRKAQEDLQNQQREMTRDLNGKIQDVISQVAKEKGATIVLQDAVYADPSVDITADVLKRLNAGGGK